MTPMASSEALGIGSAFLRDIGMLFPVRLAMQGADLEFTLALFESQLGHRTTGPYSEAHHEPTELIAWAQLRAGVGMAGRRTRISLDASGPWARMLVELEGTAVRAVVVVPEEVTAESLNATYLGMWQDPMAGSLKRALDDLSHRLYQCYRDSDGGEPLIDLRMEYRRGRGLRQAGHRYAPACQGVHHPCATGAHDALAGGDIHAAQGVPGSSGHRRANG